MMKHWQFVVFFVVLTYAGFAQSPEPPVISSLDVDANGFVTVWWNPVAGVSGYIIYREPGLSPNDVNPVPIDTLYDGNAFTYFDNSARADTCSYSYKLASFKDDIANLSEQSAISSTIFLENPVYDTCANQLLLNWSAYVGWEGKDFFYEIIKNDDNTNLIKTSELEYTDNVLAGQTNTYLIRARISGTQFTSNSNRITFTVPTLKIPDTPVITTLTNDGANFTATVSIDNSADLWGYQFQAASSAGGEYSAVDSLALSAETTLQFVQPSGDSPLFYKVVAIDVCGLNVAESEVVQPLVLDYSQQDLAVILNWNASFVESSEDYEIYLSVSNINNGTFELFETTDLKTITVDLDEIGNAESELFCFNVKSTNTIGGISLSNEVCASREPKRVIPNAFSPDGSGPVVNDYFGPFWESGNNEGSYIKNATVTKFELFIYDRYGGVVFYTDKSYKRWDGKVNYKPVGEGGYVYFYTFTTSIGKTYKGSGTINVVYP